jgi:hypothetical protein
MGHTKQWISFPWLRNAADHNGRCLRPLERWVNGFESHSRYGCLCMVILFVLLAALRPADPPSKESYLLYIRLLTYTYLRSWALLEKPPIVQPLKNFPAFHGTRVFYCNCIVMVFIVCSMWPLVLCSFVLCCVLFERVLWLIVLPLPPICSQNK